MTAYRDQYASLFHDGRNVVLIGISNDSPEALYSWLKDADFPFLFASNEADPGSTYKTYGGGLRESGTVDSRTVVVVGPDGRVAGVIPQFRQVDPQAYEELGAMIDKVTPQPEGD
jgi:peroxiredoxin